MSESKTPELNKPVLYFKIGMLGSVPLDFGEAIARNFGAIRLSSEEIRKTMKTRASAQGKTRPVHTSDIRRVLARQATIHLEDTQDVMADMFFNKVRSRQLPVDTAKNAGGLSLALSIKLPISVALSRVEQWVEEDAFGLPVTEWDVHPMRLAKGMIGNIDRPQRERIDYVLHLDGDAETPALINQVEAQLDKHGLLVDYRSNLGGA
jgi:predicted kinase